MPIKDVEKECLRDPHVLLGYMSSGKGTQVLTVPLRTLFNHAGRPLPKDLQETQAETFEISRGALAGLVYQSAKNHGEGLFSRSSLWLKTRLG